MPDVCDGLGMAGNPACIAMDAASGMASGATGTLLSAMGDTFARAAGEVLDAVFKLISTSTSVDLGAAYVTRNAAALASVALVLVVGLFVVQVVTAALRREPGGLGRALVGAGVAILGSAAAATVTHTLLVVVDELCDGIAGLAGTSIEDAVRRLLDVSVLMDLSATGGGSALLLVFGLLFMIGGTLTLGTLLVRQALVVVAVVVAPLAFAGGTSRLTAGWVRRWVQVTLALILAKLAIVVVFVVAVGMLGDTKGLGALLSGLILLLLACLAPWACFKVLDFAGTAVATEWHRATNGSTVAIANQGRVAAQSLIRAVAPVVGGPGAAAATAGSGGASGAAGSAQAASMPARAVDWAQPTPGPAGAGTGSETPASTPTEPRAEPPGRRGGGPRDLPPAGFAGEGR